MTEEAEETAHERGQRLDQYFTQPALAKRFVEWADIQPGQRVLEPSCGWGDLARHIPEHAQTMAMDTDNDVFKHWENTPELYARQLSGNIELVGGDFLAERLPSDAFDVVVMNPPYGYVGSGKYRKAADRLHVQHALRMAPDVFCLVRANFMWGQERYENVFRFAKVVKMGVLVHRPAFHGPALLPGQDSARHDFGVLHLRRHDDFDRRVDKGPDAASVEFWTNDWRLAA